MHIITYNNDTCNTCIENLKSIFILLKINNNNLFIILAGDKEKIHEIVSSMQDTYRNDNLPSQAGRQYSKINAHSSTYRSSFQLGDSGKIIEIRSTLLPFHKDAG